MKLLLQELFIRSCIYPTGIMRVLPLENISRKEEKKCKNYVIISCFLLDGKNPEFYKKDYYNNLCKNFLNEKLL